MDLQGHASNVYSQFGEDGILRAIFREIGVKHQRAVEFGAWDGIHCANTRSLVDEGWVCLLIEPEPKRFASLQVFAEAHGQIAVRGFVANTPGQKLHEYLRYADFPIDLDLVSIDIDGDDVLALTTIGDYSPRCLVIEYNRTIPVDYCYTNVPGENVGNSISAIQRVTADMKMGLVAQTPTNLIFVRDELIANSALELIQPRTQLAMFVGFNGELKIGLQPWGLVRPGSEAVTTASPHGMIQWPWTLGLVAQPIPRAFRKWPRRQEPLAAWLALKALALHPSSLRTLVDGARRYRNGRAS